MQAAHPGNVKVSRETKDVQEMNAIFTEFLIEDIVKTMECLLLDSPPDPALLSMPRSKGVEYFAE